METLDVVFSLAGEQDFQQVMKICSSSDYNGLDYMSAFYPRWMKEPRRVTFIGKIKDRVVALASALLVDAGQTAVFQGLRVVPDLRGRGIAGAIQRHLTAYIRLHYPEVRVVRLTRGGPLSPETLSKYRVITQEAILSLCCEAVDLGLFLSDLRSRLPSSKGPVTLSQQQADTLVLTPHVVSNLLPSRTIICDWEPLKPLEDNLEVLRRRKLTWIVDQESEPTALSLGTPPYAVPYRHDALRININIFGCSLPAVCRVFLAQLETLLPTLQGLLIIYAYVDPQVWSELRLFCENNAKVSFFKGYWEDILLEEDL